MTLSKIWVYAEATDGHVTSNTLEMLTKARELASTVEAVYAGGDADAIVSGVVRIGDAGPDVDQLRGDVRVLAVVGQSHRQLGKRRDRRRPSARPLRGSRRPASSRSS